MNYKNESVFLEDTYEDGERTAGVAWKKVLLQAELNVETIDCSSLSAAVPVDGILLGFLL